MKREHLRHLAVAGLGLALALCGSAGAIEVCSAPMNLDVPATTEGLYVNFITGVSGSTEASVPGFDLDTYAAASTDPTGQLKFYWGSASTGGAGVASAGDTYAVLGAAQTIGPASLFTRAAFSGDTTAWQAGVSAYLGVRFRNETSAATNYGWVQLSTNPALGFPATIQRWCYDDAGAPIATPGDVLFANGFEP